MDSLVLALPALPLLAVLVICSGQVLGYAKETFTGQLSVGLLALASLIGGGLVVADYWGKTVGILHLGTWLKSDDLLVSFNLISSGFKLQAAAVCALILLVIARYSVTQFHQQAGFNRYFLVFNCFAASLFLLLLADNLLLMFIGWYSTCTCVYTMIAYAYSQPVAAFNATRVFLAHRLGDACLLMGIGFSYSWLGSVNLLEINQMVKDLELNEVTSLALCFTTAAGVRSAQFPFSAWLSRAMEAPTLGCAAFFGALFSHSGIFLLINVRTVLEQSTLAMTVLILAGALTAVYGWVVSLTQTDLKSSIGFAIVGQLGLMFIACGLGWWQIAAWYALVHSVLRTYQLLHLPRFLQQTQHLPATPIMVSLARIRWAYVASIQRFWLDPLTDWLLVNPILRLGKDLSYFDDQIVNTLMGTPAPAINALATLAQLEEQRHTGQLEQEPAAFARGSGFAGKFAQATGVLLQWIEETFFVRGLHGGVVSAGSYIGKMAIQIEQLLLRPRYLSLFVFITLLVVF